jgi:hypothetical protein
MLHGLSGLPTAALLMHLCARCVAAVDFQAERVARVRGFELARVQALIAEHPGG